MFWAITCESGKRYSQIPEEPFHVSMAALEPRDKIPENKQVSLMIEHKGKEFLLCTLEYDRMMQVNLNLHFSKGEETFLFVSGEGTIHLSGYLDVQDGASQNTSRRKIYEYDEITNECEGLDDDNEDEEDDEEEDNSEEEDENDEDDENDELGTKRLLTLDDSEDEDSEDWQPEMDYPNRRIQRPNRSSERDGLIEDVDLNDDDDDGEEEEEEVEEEESSDAEEKSEEETEKRNLFAVPSSSFKRPRNEISPKASGFDGVNSSSKKRKKFKAGKEGTSQEGESLATQISSSESENDEMNSSIGRTPMPAKKQSFMRKTPMTNDNLKHKAKNNKKESAKKSEGATWSEQKYSRKLPCGVQIEDVKVGNGPVAKHGKYVHVYYIGKFTNNKVFDSRKPGVDKPLSFRLGKQEVIKGWDYGLEGMRVGGMRMIKVPPEMAYGKKGNGPIPPNSTLLFSVELKAVS